MVTPAPTRFRYVMLAGVFVNVVINYLDRSNISVAADAITGELGLSSIQLGYLFSAFGWTYTFLQIPGGILSDKVGIRKLYAITLVLWSLATFLQGFASGLLVLIGLRILIGIFEAPSYPMNNRIVTSWFPDNERAGAIATYTSGQFIGLAFLTPLLTIIQFHLGWRGLFFISGITGVLWGIGWYFFYRSPSEHKKVNNAELELIESGGGFTGTKESLNDRHPISWQDVVLVLSKRKLWGIYIGQFGVSATMIFFLTWFPKYLMTSKKLNFLESGLMASAPFFCAFVGVLASGFLSDYLVKKNVSVGVARKAPVITGLLLSGSIMGANYFESPSSVIAFMCVAFFGNGLASVTWVFVSLLAPKKLVGLVGGAFNFIGGSAAIIVPIVIGYLVSDGVYSGALIFISSMTIMAALSYILLVGKIERIG
ncbi:MFS transporter [soil metagenome]